jgi:hypothetical protein
MHLKRGYTRPHKGVHEDGQRLGLTLPWLLARFALRVAGQ